jgi:hypothetical protein
MINFKLYPLNRILSMMVILSMVLGFSAQPAFARDDPLPPANDNIGSPNVITLNADSEYEEIIGVRGATTEATDPNIPTAGGQPYYHSVWYTYTPDTTGQVVIHTMGNGYDTYTGYDTYLALYQGDPSAGGTQIATDDNSGEIFQLQAHGPRTGGLRGCDTQSVIVRTLTAGTEYWIEVVSKEETVENSTLVFTLYPIYLQSDAISNAIVIPGNAIGFDDIQDIANATTATTPPADPFINLEGTSARFFKSVWYTYTPAHTYDVYFYAQNNNWDAILAVFTGTPGSLTQVGEGNRGNPALKGTSLRECHAELGFTMTAGTTYYIEVAAASTSGNTNLYFNMEIPEPPPSLKSDNIADAIMIHNGDNVDWFEDVQDTSTATTEAGDPTIVLAHEDGTTTESQFYRSVWYTFTPTVDGILNLSTEGSEYDTVSAIFTGDPNDLPASLVQVAARHPEVPEELKGTRGCDEYYTLQYELTAGTTYFFEIAAYNDGDPGILMYMTMSFWSNYGEGDDVWDDENGPIEYDSRWNLLHDENAIGGTLHTANAKKSTATSTFDGSRFTVVYAKLARSGTLSIIVDGRKVANLNENSRVPSYQQQWSFASVPQGSHTLVFKNAKGKVVNMDAVIIHDAAVAAGPGIVEDTDSDYLAYKGYWQPNPDLGATFSATKGDTVTMSFSGTQVTLNYLAARGYGVMQVTIDGKRTKINQRGSSATPQSVSRVFPLADGAHTLVIKHQSGKQVNLDSLVIE